VDIPQIDLDTLEQWRRDGRPVLDVRNPDEYEQGHVPGAVLVPLGELPERLAEVPRPPEGGTLAVICQAGGRSQRACEYLAQQGYAVANVTGGTGAWMEAGRDTATGPVSG
jgi:rhodanese-related sulfurtransferase